MANWTQAELDAYYQRLKGTGESPPGWKCVGGILPRPTLDPTIVIEFRGKVPSKKNRYSPRKDKPGFFKNSKLQAELDRLALQIPGEYRDLRLESPAVDFFFTYTKANWDRDNAATAITDLLVEYKVLENDNIRRFNGKITIHPATLGEFDGVMVVLTRA